MFVSQKTDIVHRGCYVSDKDRGRFSIPASADGGREIITSYEM